jgi:hypothetical protein
MTIDGESSKDKQTLPYKRWRSLSAAVLAVAAAYVISLFVIYVAHVIVLPSQPGLHEADPVHRPPGATDPFDPRQCKAPPADCWDGYNKAGGIVCYRPSKPTPLRGNQFISPAEETICYKAIYFNVEWSSLAIVAWFLLWFVLASRGLERMVALYLKGKLRWRAAVAVAVNQYSIWYSVSVLAHYINDSFMEFYWSQLYFTLSEIATYLIVVMLLDRNVSLPYPLLVMGCGISVYHITQLLLDEFSGMLTSQKALFRDLVFISIDLTYLVAYFSDAPFRRAAQNSTRRTLVNIFQVVVCNALIFNLFFADRASFLLLF